MVSGSGAGTLGGAAAMAIPGETGGSWVVSHQASVGEDGTTGGVGGGSDLGGRMGGASSHQAWPTSGSTTVAVGTCTCVFGGTVMTRSHIGQWICVPPWRVPRASSLSQCGQRKWIGTA